MKKDTFAQNNSAQLSQVNNIIVNALGDVSTNISGYTDNFKKAYKYLECEPLKVELEDEAMRSRFGAKLRHSRSYPRKEDIRPDVLAALYGEPSDWRLVECYWTEYHVFFYLQNRVCPMSEDKYLALESYYKNGFKELYIPVNSLNLGIENALVFTVKIAADSGEYQSLLSVTSTKESVIEAIPRSSTESVEPHLFRLDYSNQTYDETIEKWGDEWEEG